MAKKHSGFIIEYHHCTMVLFVSEHESNIVLQSDTIIVPWYQHVFFVKEC